MGFLRLVVCFSLIQQRGTRYHVSNSVLIKRKSSVVSVTRFWPLQQAFLAGGVVVRFFFFITLFFFSFKICSVGYGESWWKDKERPERVVMFPSRPPSIHIHTFSGMYVG